MSLNLKDDILNAVKERVGCQTPKFRKPTPPPKPNPNYTPPPSVKKSCTYETPCGWCTKWDKKCDRQIGCSNNEDNNIFIDDNVLSPWFLESLRKQIKENDR